MESGDTVSVLIAIDKYSNLPIMLSVYGQTYRNLLRQAGFITFLRTSKSMIDRTSALRGV